MDSPNTTSTAKAPSSIPVTLPAFVAPEDRDAWSTIRGFVYQADITIVRWLTITPQQELFLESGEDIDTVTSYLESGDIQRLLEQVKHRETNLTLRSAGALAALANAHGHRTNNPELNLLFRYTTNATVGRERPSPFTDGSKGITVWESLRNFAHLTTPRTPEEEATLRKGLHTILVAATRPEDLSETVWRDYQDWLKSGPDALASLIPLFEWSTAASDAEEISDEILSLLQMEGYAADAATAYALYQRLFFNVFKTLSQPKGKRLTHAMLLAVLQEPLGSEGLKWFERFLSQMNLLDRKLSAIQGQLARQENTLNLAADRIQQLLHIQQTVVLASNVPIPIIDLPPVLETLSPRTQTVTLLNQQLKEKTWLALTGSSGSGKSTLALLMALQRGNCPMWLRFRDMDTERAAATIDAVFLHLGGGQPLASRQASYTTVCHQFGTDAVVVLDDLPPLTLGDALCQRLELLVAACRESEIGLITTSAYRLPSSLTRTVQKYLNTVDTPPLTDIEALEIIKALNAPGELVANERTVRFLNNVARRHPLLLASVCSFLQSRDWKWTDQELDALLLGQHTEDVNEETIRRLLISVAEERDRELLYRLNLVHGAFDIEVARELAAVAPAISVPRERLTKLSGPWVQRESEQMWQVSPLLRALKSGDLEESTQRECYRVLAQCIFRKGTLTPLDVDTAVTYFCSAGDNEHAVRVLVFGLLQMSRGLIEGEIDAEQAKRWGLLSTLWGLPIPAGVPLDLQLILRALQIHLGTLLGKDPNYAIQDLTGLVNQAGSGELSGLMVSAVYAVPHIAKRHFSLTCRCLMKAITLAPQEPDTDEQRILLPEISLPSLLWLNLSGIESKDEVIQWCDALGQLSPEVRAKVLADPQFSDQGAKLLVDRFWLAEDRKAPADRNWEHFLSEMDEVESKAASVGAGFLRATAFRAKILILSEKLGRHDQAITVANDALSRLPEDPRSCFLVCDSMGRKLSYVSGRDMEARQWLERALRAGEEAPDMFRWERAMTLLALSRLDDRKGDVKEAVTNLTRAMALIETSPPLPVVERAKFYGDIAIAHWNNQDRRSAFDALEAGVAQFLQLKQEGEEWKALLRVFGHTTGYMAMMSEHERPPELDDGVPFMAPALGWFHDHDAGALSRVGGPLDPSILMAQLALYAEAIGRDERAKYWVEHLLDTSQDNPETAMIVATSVQNLLTHLTRNGQYLDLFDGARQTTFTLAAYMCLDRTGNRDLLVPLDIDHLLGSRGSEDWQFAEKLALECTLVPLALHFGIRAIQVRRGDASAEHLDQSVREAIEQCLLMASVSTFSAAWTEAAEILDRCYPNNPVFDTLIRRANNYSPEHKAVRFLAYIGATMGESVNLKEACKAHMSVLPHYLRHFGLNSSGYRLLLLPFVETYWEWAVSERRFQFTPPALQQQRFQEAQADDIAVRAKHLMQTVASGLSIRNDPVVQEAFRAWETLEREKSSAREKAT